MKLILMKFSKLFVNQAVGVLAETAGSNLNCSKLIRIGYSHPRTIEAISTWV